jgi:hypothetical protein
MALLAQSSFMLTTVQLRLGLVPRLFQATHLSWLRLNELQCDDRQARDFDRVFNDMHGLLEGEFSLRLSLGHEHCAKDGVAAVRRLAFYSFMSPYFGRT